MEPASRAVIAVIEAANEMRAFVTMLYSCHLELRFEIACRWTAQNRASARSRRLSRLVRGLFAGC